MVSRDQVRALLYGLAVGDAVGLPAELRQRTELVRQPVTDLSGHGTHDQPPGTYSDDTALALCQAEALAERVPNEVEKFVADMHDMLLRWYEDAEWTASGSHFDLSLSMRTALMYLESGVNPAELPEFVEHAHGNDALVRALPISLIGRGRTPRELFDIVQGVVSLTHPHPLAVLSASYAVLLGHALVEGSALSTALSTASGQLPELFEAARLRPEQQARFDRIRRGQLGGTSAEALDSQGDAVATLEVALWCLLTTTDYRGAVLAATNLGDDADTNAALTGGLAGLCYGMGGIPDAWVRQLARSAEVGALADRLALGLA